MEKKNASGLWVPARRKSNSDNHSDPSNPDKQRTRSVFLRSIQIDWSKLYYVYLKNSFSLMSNICSNYLAPNQATQGVLEEWVITLRILLNFQTGMERLLSCKLSFDVETEQARIRVLNILNSAEAVKITISKLIETFQNFIVPEGSILHELTLPQRKYIYKLINFLYSQISYLYIEWMSNIEVGFLKDIKRLEIGLDSVEKVNEMDFIGFDSFGIDLWQQLSSGKLKWMANWSDFKDALTNHCDKQLTSQNERELQSLLDFSHSGVVSLYQFGRFLSGWGPTKSTFGNFISVTSEPWYHGYVSTADAELLLHSEPKGSFIIRLKNPFNASSFILSFSDEKTISHLPIKCDPSCPNRFYILLQDGERRSKFSSLPALIYTFTTNKYLDLPITDRFHKERWFYYDLSGSQTSKLLSSQNHGTFLVRWSNRFPGSLATACVSPSGKIIHSLIDKNYNGTRGWSHLSGPTFSTLEQCLEAYQSVLRIPFCKDYNTEDNILKSITLAAQNKIDKEITESLIGPSHLPVLFPSLNGKDKSNFKFLACKTLIDSNEVPTKNNSRWMIGVHDTRSKKSQSFNGVFGRPLKEIMKQTSPDQPIPFVLDQSLRFCALVAKTPGLFMTKESSTLLQFFVLNFDSGVEVDLFDPDENLLVDHPHLGANIVTQFIRELPEPLIPSSEFDHFIKYKEDVIKLKKLIKKLPKENSEILKAIIKLLSKLTEFSKYNKTSSAKLATIGTLFLRTDEDLGLSKALELTPKIHKCVQTLIENYWYMWDEKMSERNISFWAEISVYSGELIANVNRRKIQEATLERLVSCIYYWPPFLIEAFERSVFCETLRITYITFTTPTQLFNELIKHYHKLEAQIPNSGSQAHVLHLHYLLRLSAFIKKWCEESSDYIIEDPILLQDIETFISGIPVSKSWSRPLLSSLRHLKEKTHTLTTEFLHSVEPPESIYMVANVAIKDTLKGVKPIEMARQITLIDFANFSKIKREEMLKIKDYPQHNLLNFVDRFNCMTWWFVSMILTQSRDKARSVMIGRIIKVGQCLKKLNNFNGVQCVIAALSSSAVSRLELFKKKWLKSPSYIELKELMSSSANFKKYKEWVRKCSPPVIPYLGIHLSEILTLCERETNKRTDEHIGFAKCYKMAEIVNSLQQWQRTPYNLIPIEAVAELLANINKECMNEEDCYALSLKIQPTRSNC